MYLPYDRTPDKIVPGPGTYDVPLNTIGANCSKYTIGTKTEFKRTLFTSLLYSGESWPWSLQPLWPVKPDGKAWELPLEKH